ncbi:MAG: cytochrome c biogenesis protein CcdA [Dehalococcoidia bacterium]|nr:cytochrome c biogenesis protein CcdA [Dehalococcoidia bacterium]
MEAQSVTLLLAFGAGILSFISPCVLPLVPVYVAHLAGSTAHESEGRRMNTFLHALSFVIGFSLVFVALGAAMGLIGSAVAPQMPLLRKVVGVVLVALGIHLTGLVKIPWLYREKRLNYAPRSAPGFARSFLVGSAFSIGWTPCIGPILGAIFALAWDSQTVGQGASLLAAYSLGLGVPFLAAGLALTFVSSQLKRLNRFLNLISIVSGLTLIVLGVLIFTGTLEKLSRYFTLFGGTTP